MNVPKTSLAFWMLRLAMTAANAFFSFNLFQDCGVTIFIEICFNVFLRIIEAVTYQIIILEMIILFYGWRSFDHFSIPVDNA